jgi:hypothetical protein
MAKQHGGNRGNGLQPLSIQMFITIASASNLVWWDVDNYPKSINACKSLVNMLQHFAKIMKIIIKLLAFLEVCD